MKTVTKIGLVFFAIGFLLLLGLLINLVMFVVGGSGNPPLSSPLREFVSFTIQLGTFWFIFVIIGAVLVAVGAFRRRRNE